MPLTPFHYPISYVISKLDNKFILPGLIVGSMLPDIEIPAIILLFGERIPHRLVLHSLSGAVTIGTLLSVIVTMHLYPYLANILFRINKEVIRSKCIFSNDMIISCLLGSVSHVLLDVLTHPYNPIFWPFEEITASPVFTILGCVSQASLFINIFLASFILVLLLMRRKNPWEKLLLG